MADHKSPGAAISTTEHLKAADDSKEIDHLQTESSTNKFTFFPKLPLEIKHMIWKLSFARERLIHLMSTNVEVESWRGVVSTDLKITNKPDAALSVCLESREIYLKQFTLPLLTKSTKFYVDPGNDVIYLESDELCWLNANKMLSLMVSALAGDQVQDRFEAGLAIISKIKHLAMTITPYSLLLVIERFGCNLAKLQNINDLIVIIPNSRGLQLSYPIYRDIWWFPSEYDDEQFERRFAEDEGIQDDDVGLDYSNVEGEAESDTESEPVTNGSKVERLVEEWAKNEYLKNVGLRFLVLTEGGEEHGEDLDIPSHDWANYLRGYPRELRKSIFEVDLREKHIGRFLTALVSDTETDDYESE